SSQVTVAVNTNMMLDVTSDSDTTLFRHKTFQLDGVADYQLQSQLFNISRCDFMLEDAGFSLTGSADLTDTTDLDFRVKGNKQDFNLFTAFVPGNLRESLKPFRYDGKLFFNAMVKGKITKERQPLIEISFGCEDAWFLNTNANKKVDQLGFKGFYTNGSE